ncbi:hypothetical protein F1559_004741 [Cyanidiococcus yangmingshanensis]|uniref:Uncharacterized protein n=1 Tax=Cyanidiococcus yangmingshanensis TaxID=2690220 RepID=A0A7J7IKE1_9RHOD|nr:hypothetical protein F1559_004741 [Cyanidiococcus yangmingshanensis]
MLLASESTLLDDDSAFKMNGGSQCKGEPSSTIRLGVGALGPSQIDIRDQLECFGALFANFHLSNCHINFVRAEKPLSLRNQNDGVEGQSMSVNGYVVCLCYY